MIYYFPQWLYIALEHARTIFRDFTLDAMGVEINTTVQKFIRRDL